jgi:hypothetical protein
VKHEYKEKATTTIREHGSHQTVKLCHDGKQLFSACRSTDVAVP